MTDDTHAVVRLTEDDLACADQVVEERRRQSLKRLVEASPLERREADASRQRTNELWDDHDGVSRRLVTILRQCRDGLDHVVDQVSNDDFDGETVVRVREIAKRLESTTAQAGEFAELADLGQLIRQEDPEGLWTYLREQGESAS